METEGDSRAHIDKLTTNAELFARLLSGAVARGIDMASILRDCSVPGDFATRPGYRMPIGDAVTVLQKCRVICGDEFLFLLKNPIPLGYFRLSVLCISDRPTLGDALSRYIDFGNTFFNSLSFHLATKASMAELTVTRDSSGRVHDNVAIDSVLATVHRLAGWLCDELIILDRVLLDFSPPSYKQEYRYLFYNAPVEFGDTRNALIFDAKYLDLPIVQNEAAAERYVRRAPLDIYLPQDIRGQTSQLVRTRLKSSIVNDVTVAELQTISKELKISSQTLRRRLAQEGTTFNRLKSQVRRDLAMNALGKKSLSIDAVAEQAGYSEPASFIRSFKGWTGMTPAKFRKLIRMA